MIKGISRRWFVNTIGIVLVVLIVFILALSFTVQSYTYSSLSQILRGRIDTIFNVLSSSSPGFGSTADFSLSTRGYIEDFSDKNTMEIMAIDPSGRVLVTSTGFSPDQEQQKPDFDDAISSSDGYGYWADRLDTGEKVMAITRALRDKDGNIIGSLRCIISLENADQQIWMIIIALVVAGIFIVLITFSTGLYFIRSIIVPVRAVTSTAKQISQGDFEVRIKKKKDDEIGELCDAVNDMAGELGESEKMKNEFISSVSHELRTPLTSIKGWAETINSGVDEDTKEKGMHVIITEAERLSGIVEELLDFSRLQSGRMNIDIKKADIFSALEEVVYMFTNRAKKENKTINYSEPSAFPVIFGDSNRLKQVFVNVIDNAFKYTAPGGRIEIYSNENDGFINIIISDNGIGIPAEHLNKVKKRFYKANQNIRGSGIGLAVVDEIMKLHFGSLSIESELYSGTTVTISIPTCDTFEKLATQRKDEI